MKKIVLISIFALISVSVFSQKVILSKKFKPEETPKFGPNRAFYVHSYIGYGMFVDEPEGEGSPVKMLNSGNFRFGANFKFKTFSFNAVGFKAEYQNYGYKIGQSDKKTLPDSIIHLQEKIVLNTFSFYFYDRINIGRHGDHLGKYLEIGGYYDFNYSKNHIAKDEFTNDSPSYIKTRNVNWLNNSNYGVYGELGFNKISVFAKYRLSDMFDSKYSYDELPRICVGVNLAMF